MMFLGMLLLTQVWENCDVTQNIYNIDVCLLLDITGSIYCIIPRDLDHVSMYILPFSFFLYRVNYGVLLILE